jgi:hypothetical protein
MDRADQLSVSPAPESLAFESRLDLAKAHCALMFEDRGGKLTDVDVVVISRLWAAGDDEESRFDTDLLAGHLFAWLS